MAFGVPVLVFGLKRTVSKTRAEESVVPQKEIPVFKFAVCDVFCLRTYGLR